MGEDFDEQRAGTFQEKAMESATKSAKLSGEDKAAWLAATATGFESYQQMTDKARSNIFTPLSASSCASEVDTVGVTNNILGKAAAEIRGEEWGKGGAGSAAGTHSQSVVVSGGATQESPAKGGKPVDLASSRNQLWGSVRDQSSNLRAKLAAEIKAAALADRNSDAAKHGKIFIEAVQERLRIAATVLGVTHTVTITKEDGDAEKSEKMEVLIEPIEWKEEASQQQGELSAAEKLQKGAEIHDKALRDLLDTVTILPMESREVMSWSRFVVFHADITKILTEEALEEANRKWDNQQHLVTQLTTSLKQSSKELNAEIKAVISRQQKVKSKQERERKEVELEAKKSAEELARKQLRHEKVSVAFALNLSDHVKIHAYANDDEYDAKKVDFSRPWVVAASAMAAKLFSAELGETTALRSTAGNWQKAFAKSMVYKENDVVSSPLTARMGALELAQLMEHLLPTDSRVRAAAPTLAVHLDATKIYGESALYANYDFEQAFLGSVRLQLTGLTRFLAMRPDELIQWLCKQSDAPPSAAGLQLVSLRQKLMALTQADVDSFAASGAKIYHCDLDTKGILYLPPGWLFAQTTANGDAASAIKRWFLPFTALESTKEVLTAMSPLGMRGQIRETIQLVDDIISVKVVKGA